MNMTAIPLQAWLFFAALAVHAAGQAIPQAAPASVARTAAKAGTDPERAARAQELLKQARLALGSDEAWARIRTLMVSGDVRTTTHYISVQAADKVEEKVKVQPSRITLSILLPNMCRLEVEEGGFRGSGQSTIQVVDGEETWQHPPAPFVSKPGAAYDVEAMEKSAEALSANVKRRLSIYSLALFLKSLPGYPLVFQYDGEVEVEGRKALALRGQNQDGYSVVLLLDAVTYQPFGAINVFLSAVAPNVVIESSKWLDAEGMKKLAQRRQQELNAGKKEARMHELRVTFSDYRRTEGVLWPHMLSMQLDGQALEQVSLGELKLNVPLNRAQIYAQPKR